MSCEPLSARVTFPNAGAGGSSRTRRSPITRFVGRHVVLLLTLIVLTACGASRTAAPKRCGLSLDGQVLLPGSVKRLDYSMRTRTINGRARVETWRVTG